MSKNYYETLGVSKTCTQDDIKKAYRKLAVLYHPDKVKTNSEDVTQKFIEINEAYEVLKDEQKRNIYDQYGMEGLKGLNGTSTNDSAHHATMFFTPMTPQQAENIFKSVFGGGGGGGGMSGVFGGTPLSMAFGNGGGFSSSSSTFGLQGSKAFSEPDIFMSRMKRKDPPIVKELLLPMQDFYNGAIKQIKITRSELDEKTNEKVSQEQVVSINVSAESKEEFQVILPNMGDITPGVIPADLIFIVKCKSHSRFTREGNKLIYTHPLSLKEMLCGLSIVVPTLDEKSTLHYEDVPPVVNPQVPIVIRGKGFMTPLTHARDDLIVRFNTVNWDTSQVDIDKLKQFMSQLSAN